MVLRKVRWGIVKVLLSAKQKSFTGARYLHAVAWGHFDAWLSMTDNVLEK